MKKKTLLMISLLFLIGTTGMAQIIKNTVGMKNKNSTTMVLFSKPLPTTQPRYLRIPAATRTKINMGTKVNNGSMKFLKSVQLPGGKKAQMQIVRKSDNDQSQVVPNKDNSSVPAGNEGSRICTKITKSYDVTSMDQGMLTPGALNNICLGGVYSLTDLQAGNYRPITDNRSPISLQMTEKDVNPIDVKTPTVPILNQQLEVMRSQRYTSMPQGFGQYLQSSLITSASDFSLAIGASYSGYGVSLADKFGYSNNSNKTKYLLTYLKPVYATSAYPDNGIFFNNGDAKNSDPTLVYISQITYGVRLMVYFECEEDASVITNTFKGSGWGASLNVETALKDRMSAVKFTTYLYGNGDPVQTYTGFKELFDGTNAEINRIASNPSLIPREMGQPLSYTMRFVDDNSIAATTCSILNSPVTVCNIDPAGPQSLQVWLSDAHRWSDLHPFGFMDIELLDRNGNTISNQKLFDGKFTDVEANNIDNNIDNHSADYGASPYHLNFDNISKEDRQGGTLRIWSHFEVDGHSGRCFCANEKMTSAPNNASADPSHHVNAS